MPHHRYYARVFEKIAAFENICMNARKRPEITSPFSKAGSSEHATIQVDGTISNFFLKTFRKSLEHVFCKTPFEKQLLNSRNKLVKPLALMF